MPKPKSKPQPTSQSSETPPAVDNVSERDLVAMFTKPAPSADASADPSPASDSAQASPQPAPDTDATREPQPAEPDQPPVSEPSPPTEPEAESPPEPQEAPQQPEKPEREFEYTKFQKRVDELTAEKRRLQEEIERIKATEPSASSPEPAPQVPVQAPTVELKDFDARIAAANQMVAWAERNPDGADDVDMGNGKVASFNREQVLDMKARAMADMARLNAERAVRMAEFQRNRMAQLAADINAAASQFPWLRDQNSAEFAQARAMIQTNPGLLNEPDVVWVVAAGVEARKARLRGPAGKARSPAASRPTPVVTRPEASVQRNGADSAVRKELEAAQKRAEETGSIQDYQHLLALKSRLVATGARV